MASSLAQPTLETPTCEASDRHVGSLSMFVECNQLVDVGPVWCSVL